ncbi:MAG: amidase family protein, partial [Verrucomicrobiota bacterium]
DAKDAYARKPGVGAPLPTKFRFGVPKSSQLEFFGNRDAKKLFSAAVAKLESIGGERVVIDFAPFLEAARLLYEGPWVAERFVAIEEILRERPSILHPVTRKIIKGGGKPRAAEAFKAEYRLRELKRLADEVFEDVNVITTPTAGTIYTIAEVKADPIQTNSNLGYYTNFMNLLDFSAVAVPAGFQKNGLPFGVTMFGPAFQDRQLLELGARFTGETNGPSNQIPPGWTPVVVCGVHMDGVALNWQLRDRGARFLERTQSAKKYRLYALPPVGDKIPPRPGMTRVARGGAAIEVEVWALPTERFGDFVAQIPAPLGIGKVELEDGRQLPGFICEPIGIKSAEEITSLGSWRKFVKRSN